MTASLDLGFDMGSARNPGGEPPWWPYRVPVDATNESIRTMDPPELLTAFHDTMVVTTRAMLGAGEWPNVDDDTYEALVDVRDRLEREIHRRLREVQHQAERERQLLDRVAATRSGSVPAARLGEGGRRALGGNA